MLSELVVLDRSSITIFSRSLITASLLHLHLDGYIFISGKTIEKTGFSNLQTEPEFRPQMSEVVQDIRDMIRRESRRSSSNGESS